MTAVADPVSVSSPPRTVRLVLAAALVIALLASLVWLVVGLVDLADDDESMTTERESVMLRAQEYVDAAWNYGADDLDDEQRLTEYQDRVNPLITTSFGSEFEKTVPVLEQLVAEEGFARTTSVDHVGVETVSPDAATVIVNGRIVESQDGTQLDPTPFFWRLDLERVDGSWLVADLGGFEGAR